MKKMVRILMSALVMTLILPVAYAVSKDTQELMTLRAKSAPLNCEMTQLYRQLGEARKANDQAKVRTLTERMKVLEKKLSADSARMQELRKLIGQHSPDYPAILQQQVELDKACNKQLTRP
jgi:flagellar motility protein MotE (MotC chaperone)